MQDYAMNDDCLISALKPPIVTVISLPEKNGFNVSWISETSENEVNLKVPGKSTWKLQESYKKDIGKYQVKWFYTFINNKVKRLIDNVMLIGHVDG